MTEKERYIPKWEQGKIIGAKDTELHLRLNVKMMIRELNCQNQRIKELETENKQLKKDRFVCLDCKYCGYTEIGCLCEKQDHWEEFKNECNDFKELKY